MRFRKRSPVWNYFQKAGDVVACCLCRYVYSHTASTSSLAHHLHSQHGIKVSKPETKESVPPLKEDLTDSSDIKGHFLLDQSDVSQGSNRARVSKPGNSHVWKYMRKDERCVTCQICNKELSRGCSTSSLAGHLKKVHGLENLTKPYPDLPDISDVPTLVSEQKIEFVSTQPAQPKPKLSYSYIWKYLQKGPDFVTCLICERQLSAKSSSTSLAGHLERDHDLVNPEKMEPIGFDTQENDC